MLSPFAANLLTTHLGQLGGRGLSPRLWSRVGGQALSGDGASNWHFSGDDFNSFGLTTAVAANVGRYAGQAGAYLSYEDTGNSIAQLASEVGGVMRVATDATDNDESWIQPGGAASVLGKVSTTAGADKCMIFEQRVRFGQVSNTFNFLGGLSEEGLAAADTVTDAGALADKDFIGFWITEADGDALKFGYRKAGGALQTVLSSAIAVSTWYKLGFVYDPSAPPAKRIKVFIDNVEQSTYVTSTNLAAATFPDGEELNWLFGIKNGEAAIKNADCDWWHFGQEG